MGWLLRFSGRGPSGHGAEDGEDDEHDDELLMSRLWDLGTIGVFQSADGALGAGFADEATATMAADALAGSGVIGDRRLAVERAADPADWIGDDEPRQLTVAGPAGPIELALRTGGAFGHGEHPTTTLALALLLDTVGPDRSVLDVGTGTGILAIAAAKAGAGPVVAIDIEPGAVATAEENAAANRAEVTCRRLDGTELVEAGLSGFEVVVVNVLLPIHRRLAAHMATIVGGSGTLITSGYLTEQADELVALYRDGWGDDGALRVVERRSDAGWVAHRFGSGPESGP